MTSCLLPNGLWISQKHFEENLSNVGTPWFSYRFYLWQEAMAILFYDVERGSVHWGILTKSTKSGRHTHKSILHLDQIGLDRLNLTRNHGSAKLPVRFMQYQ